MTLDLRLRRLGSALGVLGMAVVLAATAAAQRTERPALNITGYVIDAEREGGGDVYRA